MRRIVCFVALTAAIALAGTGTVTHGQSGPCSYPGCPDPTFGGTGIVVTPSLDYQIGSIAVQRIGGEERVVGLRLDYKTWVMARYTGSGQLDGSFGTAGVVTRTFGKKDGYWPYGVVAQTDNKLLVLNLQPSGVPDQPRLAVTRYLPNAPSIAPGPYDAAFGNGGDAALGDYQTSLTGPMALQSDGKVVVASHRFVTADKTVDSYIHRLTPAGSLDPSFGTGGVARSVGGGYVHSVAIQQVPNADGVLEDRILVSSSVSTMPGVTPGHWIARLQRFMPDGSPDTTFADAGATTLDIPGAEGTDFEHLAVDASGRIVAAGSFYARLTNGTLDYHVLVVRYAADGALDPIFADGGIFRQDWLGDDHNGRGVAIHPDGRILVAGGRGNKFAGTLSLVVWRLLDSGLPDLTFGSNGLMTITGMTCGQRGGPIFVRGGTAFVVGGASLVRKSRNGFFSPVFAVGRFIY